MTHAPEQLPAAALRLLERPGPHLGGETARDLAHRGQERQAPVRRLDRLVRDAGGPGGDERPGEGVVRREMQVGEEDEILPDRSVLLGQRFLDLQDELCGSPDGVPPDELRSDRSVRGIGQSAPDTGARLDEDVVSPFDELARSGRGERDAMLVRLDLRHDPDPHRGGL